MCLTISELCFEALFDLYYMCPTFVIQNLS